MSDLFSEADLDPEVIMKEKAAAAAARAEEENAPELEGKEAVSFD